ncbi:MAG: stage II sporulation protein M, partial [Anaerolineae bacterium]|nr:stage II sporulation protein M [Anaerolineae bacterium]
GIPFQTIWGHNLQAIAVILLLGMVSCGVLGVVIYLLNVGIVGAVLALIQVTGGSPVKIGLAGILPHGIFEIPALILASAAVFQIGILLVTPNPRRSLGEVMIAAFADWAKVTVSMVIPLLTIAAMVEAWVTPWLLSLVVK